MTKKPKITYEGQPCRTCLTPVIKREGGKTRRKGQKYYFRWYLYCPKCKTMYMVNSQKVLINYKGE